MKRQKVCFALDTVGAILFILSTIYFIIYSIAIFPPIAVKIINENPQQSVAGALGIAFSSAIAVSVIAIVLSLLGCLLLIFSVVVLIGALRSRRLITKGKKKAYAAWQIVSAVFIFVITLFTVAMGATTYIQFLPSLISACVGFVLFVVTAILKFQEKSKQQQSVVAPQQQQ